MVSDNALVGQVNEILGKGEWARGQTQGTSPGYVAGAPYAEFRTQAIAFAYRILDENNAYTRDLAELAVQPTISALERGIGTMRALRNDLASGYLTSLRELVEAEVFSDFLDMARHLLDNGFHHPAASLCGAVLEDGLRKIARSNGEQVPDRDELGSLASRLAQKRAYNALALKQLQVWIEVRNAADHGRWNDFTAADTSSMIEGVTGFLAQHLGS